MPSGRLSRNIHVRPEIQLLLCCARGEPDTSSAERIRTLVRDQLNWVELIKEAVPHGLLPLVYWNLARICPKSVPPETLRQLQMPYEFFVRRNRKMTGDLLTLLGAFESAGIPAMPFKGPVLAHCFYDEPGLREFGDLDILVKRENLRPALLSMQDQGYSLASFRCIDDALEQASSAKDLMLVNPDGTRVELHWELMDPGYFVQFDLNSIWQRARMVRICETAVPSFHVHDVFLYLVVHGFKHRWERLDWLGDLARVVRQRPDLDWSAIRAEARLIGAEKIFDVALLLIRDALELGVDFPGIDLNGWTTELVASRLAERWGAPPTGRVMDNLFINMFASTQRRQRSHLLAQGRRTLGRRFRRACGIWKREMWQH